MNNYEIPKNILENLGIGELNQMQIDAFHTIQESADTQLIAPTGSGKTLAFLLPIFNLMKQDVAGVQCLVITPSRELAIQIEHVWRKMSTGFKVNTCYGGHSTKVEIQNFAQSPAILIGTPGRIADHIHRRSIDLRNVQYLVLDEFDKSLSMGFEEDMTYILDTMRNLDKRVLVSATNLTSLPAFVAFKKHKTLDFSNKEVNTNDAFQLKSVEAELHNRKNTLLQLISALETESTLIFCNLRETAEQISQFLKDKGLEVDYFHGKLDQLEREKTLIKFRNGSSTYLVATDLAARGLDIPLVKNVIHYELPHHHEEFINRNGRTARMNASGTAFILLNSDENSPHYLTDTPEEFKLPKKTTMPNPSLWTTVYVSGGKKDKLSKMDIVGFFAKVGQLTKEDIGLIEVMDFMTFVAVKKDKAENLLHLVKEQKMKGKKYKINLAW